VKLLSNIVKRESGKAWHEQIVFHIYVSAFRLNPGRRLLTYIYIMLGLQICY